MSRFKVGIVGLGAIASGYEVPDSNHCLTYGRAFDLSPDFDIAWGVDPSAEQRISFQKKFNCPTYASLSEVHANETFCDLVVIATPTKNHLNSIREVTRLKPRLISLEKPLAMNLGESQELLKVCSEANVALYVNYQRRLDPGLLQLRESLQSLKWGAVVSMQLTYSRGLLNNAGHYFDLIQYLLGAEKSWTVLNSAATEVEMDRYSGLVSYGGTPIAFHGVDFSILSGSIGGTLDLEIYCEEARVSVLDFGRQIQVRRRLPDAVFPGFSTFNGVASIIPTDMLHYMSHVVVHLASVLKGGQTLASDGQSAYLVQQLCEEIREKATARI